MTTAVLLCGRDRVKLVERCLDALNRARYGRRDHDVLFWRDPETTEFDERWLESRGAMVMTHGSLAPTDPPRRRVAAMRCAAIRHACALGYDRLLFLDSDVELAPDALTRLDDLWPLLGPTRCGALALGNYAGYEVPGFMIDPTPVDGAQVSIRRVGLGGCLAFPMTERLRAKARDGVPEGASWDTHLCRKIADERVLTSDVSYCRHLGRDSGMCQRVAPGLDWHRFAPSFAA